MLAGSQTGLLYAAPLLGGDDGTEQTIRMIRGLVDDAWKDPFVNRTAIEIVRNAGVPQYDSLGQVRAIYNWVHSNFYFVNDPVSKEAVRPTRDLLQLFAGDCDDINANVLPALLGSIGYDVRLVTIAADAGNPDAFTHVYCEVYLDGQWIPLDAARPGASFAAAPPRFFRREWWSLTDSGHGDYSDDAATMAGYGRAGVRGLGDFSTDLNTILLDGSTVLRSVSGQTVQPVVGSAIGPGGMTYSTLPAPTTMSGSTELLLVLGIAALIWAVA